MGFMSGEEVVVTLVPVAVYWVYAGIYEALLEHTTVLDRYRLHSRRDEETKNIASRKDVVRGVLLQQAIQVAISVAVLKVSAVRTQLFIVIYRSNANAWL
jgi:sphinganine C4-monooxygenase